MNCAYQDQILTQSASMPFLGLTDCEFRTDGIAVHAEGLAVSGDLVFDGLTAPGDSDTFGLKRCHQS